MMICGKGLYTAGFRRACYCILGFSVVRLSFSTVRKARQAPEQFDKAVRCGGEWSICSGPRSLTMVFGWIFRASGFIR